MRMLLIAISILTACPLLAAQQTSVPIPHGSEVIVIAPRVTIEMLVPSPAAKNAGELPYEPSLVNAATGQLSSKGYLPIQQEKLMAADPAFKTPLDELWPLESRLARGAINDDGLKALGDIDKMAEGRLILVQFMRITLGSGAEWGDSPTGTNAKGAMSSMLVQAALLSPSSRSVLWKNEIMERSVYRAGSDKYEKLLSRLYTTLNMQGVKK